MAKIKIEQTSVSIGKVPPQAVDIEETVLADLLFHDKILYIVSDILSPDMFYKEHHGYIYEAILDLENSGTPIDVLTVQNKLKENDKLELIGGPYFITMLSGKNTASGLNIEYHARIIYQKYIKRELIRAGSEIITLAYDDSNDVFDLLDKFSDEAFKFSVGKNKRSVEKVDSVSMEMIEKAEKIRSGEIKEEGIPTHIHELNRIIYGFRAPDFIIISARPGAGKTALMVSIILEQAKKGIRIGIFSLEMSKQQLIYRMASQLCGIPYNMLIRPAMLSGKEYKAFINALSLINSLPIFIDDTAGISIHEFRMKSKEMTVLYGVEIIYIDYLQLMRSPDNKGNREGEVAEVARTMKGVAKTLDIPVVSLAQLSRAVEQRPDKRPRLSDLRESGSLEQETDVVAFLYRPSYYHIISDPNGQFTDEEMKVLCEMEIAKHRNGALETIPLRFDKVTMRFDNFYAVREIENTQLPMDLETGDDPF